MISVVPCGSRIWRAEIDSLWFHPTSGPGGCAVHRLAFRRLIGREPTAAECLAYFDWNKESFLASAGAKISARGLAADTNFHLTSRDIIRAVSNGAE